MAASHSTPNSARKRSALTPGKSSSTVIPFDQLKNQTDQAAKTVAQTVDKQEARVKPCKGWKRWIKNPGFNSKVDKTHIEDVTKIFREKVILIEKISSLSTVAKNASMSYGSAVAFTGGSIIGALVVIQHTGSFTWVKPLLFLVFLIISSVIRGLFLNEIHRAKVLKKRYIDPKSEELVWELRQLIEKIDYSSDKRSDKRSDQRACRFDIVCGEIMAEVDSPQLQISYARNFIQWVSTKIKPVPDEIPVYSSRFLENFVQPQTMDSSFTRSVLLVNIVFWFSICLGFWHVIVPYVLHYANLKEHRN